MLSGQFKIQTHTTRLLVLLHAICTVASAAQASQLLSGHVPASLSLLNLQPVGRLAETNRLKLVIGLPLRNRVLLTNVLERLSEPTNSDYHKYMTPEQFSATFDPSEKDYGAVVEFAKSHGFEVTARHGDRALVDIEGPVAAIEKTFRVRILTYRHPNENRTFFAPDVEPSLDLDVPVIHITGLDDYRLPRSNLRPMSGRDAFGAPGEGGSSPLGYYVGYDFRAAYAAGVSATGSGQVVGLLELDAYYLQDIQEYESVTGLPEVSLQNVYLSGATGYPGSGDSEVCADIEMAIAMAPGLEKVVVYEAPNGGGAWLDALSEMAQPTAGEGLPRQLSSSWELLDNPSADQYYQRLAAQGQSFFQASGDDGAYYPGISQSADSSFVTIVGGTQLATGPGGAWSYETTFNDDGLASGGGISTSYRIPTWQQNINMQENGGSYSYRNVPDVSMVASDVEIVCNGSWEPFEGTSLAAPLWAGFTALANEQAAENGEPAMGFLNPALYALGKGAYYLGDFHDINDGSDNGVYNPFTYPSYPAIYFAVPGYDLCTGWGSPIGADLINALAPPPSDLTRQTDHLLDSSVMAGNVLNVSLTIENVPCSNGGQAAGPFHVGFYWANNSGFVGAQLLQEYPVAGCAAFGSVSVATQLTVPVGTPPGTWYLGYKIDNEKEILECNETDKGIFSWTVNVLPGLPVILDQPVSQPDAVLGSAVDFSVEAVGAAPLNYQWRKNGVPLADSATISGVTSPVLSIASVATTDAGTYNLVVANSFGDVISAGALLEVPSNQLSLTIVGAGSVSPYQNNELLTIGDKYKLQAIPSSGWLFGEWTGSVDSAANPLQFTMQPYMRLTATLVPDEFPSEAGIYDGLFWTNPVTLETAGFVENLSVTQTGSYSGKIFLSGESAALTGRFDPFGNTITAVNRSASDGGAVILSMKLTNSEIIGVIYGSNGSVWSGSLNCTMRSRNQASSQWTVLIPPSSTGAPEESPGGDGYLFISSSSGTARVAGSLADGTTVSEVTGISARGDMPLFAQLYGGAGMLLGWVNVLSNSPLSSSGLTWIHPPRPIGLYTSGFTNIVLGANLELARWTNIGLPSINLSNGQLTVSDTVFDNNAGQNFPVFVTDKNALTQMPGATNSLSGTINAQTGLMTIHFRDVSGEMTTGYGAILQGTRHGGGFFLTKTNAKAIQLLPQ